MKVSLKNEPPTTLLQHGYKNILQIPLSPPKGYQNSPNPCRSLIMQGFLFGTMPNHSSEIKILVSDSVRKQSPKIYSPAFAEILVY